MRCGNGQERERYEDESVGRVEREGEREYIQGEAKGAGGILGQNGKTMTGLCSVDEID